MGKSRAVEATHQTREHRKRQETKAKARLYFFIFSSFPRPEGGTSSRQPPLPRPRWRSKSARMETSVLRAAAPGKRLLSGSRAGCPLRGARSGADRGASQDDSGDCRCCRGRPLVRARFLQPPPPPLPPHFPPARPGSLSVPPATNGRRVLASHQPIACGAATPHTPVSWKETRHPRPAVLAPPPVPARATPPLRLRTAHFKSRPISVTRTGSRREPWSCSAFFLTMAG